MTKSYALLKTWLFFGFVTAVVPLPVTSRTMELDLNLPTPELTYNSPKSSLVQVTWKVRESGGNYDFEVALRDPTDKIFLCDNDNFNYGLCTISGLSGNTIYNVTVRACKESACGPTAILLLTTPPEARINFGSIFIFFIAIVVFAFVALNYDLCTELLQPIWTKLKTMITGRTSTPASSPETTFGQGSATSTSDIPLSSLNREGSVEEASGATGSSYAPEEQGTLNRNRRELEQQFVYEQPSACIIDEPTYLEQDNRQY